MRIRSLLMRDVPALLQMASNEAGFEGAKDGVPGFWTEKQLRQWISSKKDVLLAAEENGEVVGFVLTTLHYPTGKATWENQLVLPKHRGRGIGEVLAKEMEIRLREKGATYLHFLVREDNGQVAHYARQGFTKGHAFRWFEKAL